MPLARATLAAALAGLVVAAACSGGGAATPPSTTASPAPPPTTPAPRGNVDGLLKIGVLAPVTGPQAPLGQSLSKAVELAVTQINSAGGVNGKPVAMVLRDEGTDIATAASSFDELVKNERVDAIVGPTSSRVALASLDKLATDQVVACSATATANALSTTDDQGWFYRTIPSDALEARRLARAIGATGTTSVAILTSDDDYGQSFAQSFEPALPSEVKVVGVVRYDPTATDVSSYISQAMEHEPQTITVIGGAEAGARILAGLQAQHVTFTGALGTAVYVSDGMRRPDLSELISPGHPDVVKGISGISPATEPTSADWYTNAFSAFAPGVRDLYGAYAYDCVNLLALAAQVAGTDNPAVFRADLVPVSTGGQTCRDFSECLDVLREGRNIDLDGAFRPLDLDENGDAEFGTYDLFTFGDDGKDVRVRQVSTVGT